MILSVLLKRDFSLFEKMQPKLNDYPNLQQCIKNYYESKTKFCLLLFREVTQVFHRHFLIALQRTLSENELLDVMPETNYEAAISVIERWKRTFLTHTLLSRKV